MIVPVASVCADSEPAISFHKSYCLSDFRHYWPFSPYPNLGITSSLNSFMDRRTFSRPMPPKSKLQPK